MAADEYHVGDSMRVRRGELHRGIRHTFVHRFRERAGLPLEEHGVVLLQGGPSAHVYNTDNVQLFRQEPFFHYLFGAHDLADAWGALDLRTQRAFLFAPRLPPEYAVWMGRIATPEELRERYGVDEVRYVDELAAVLGELAPPCLHVLDGGVNTDSGLAFPPVSFPGMDQFVLETRTLHPVLAECRVFKSEGEVAVMRYAAQAAARAHVAVMQAVKPGQWEFQAEALYLHTIYAGAGCRTPHYTPILASGPNAAVLHYGHAGAPNDRRLGAGELLLVDAGASFYGYAADITTTFPVSGRFTTDQALVYNAVLGANRAVVEAMRPGVRWPDMHLLAERTILAALRQGGLLAGEVEEMVEARVAALFMPHGLGHFLGLDTHDVGGYGPGLPDRPAAAGLARLRTARPLEAGMVITVEPGCYFSAALLEPALKDPALARHLVEPRLRQLMGMGGVRIEDDVLVTEHGAQRLASVPRSVAEVEAVMAGAPWPPAAAEERQQ